MALRIEEAARDALELYLQKERLNLTAQEQQQLLLSAARALSESMAYCNGREPDQEQAVSFLLKSYPLMKDAAGHVFGKSLEEINLEVIALLHIGTAELMADLKEIAEKMFDALDDPPSGLNVMETIALTRAIVKAHDNIDLNTTLNGIINGQTDKTQRAITELHNIIAECKYFIDSYLGAPRLIRIGIELVMIPDAQGIEEVGRLISDLYALKVLPQNQEQRLNESLKSDEDIRYTDKVVLESSNVFALDATTERQQPGNDNPNKVRPPEAPENLSETDNPELTAKGTIRQRAPKRSKDEIGGDPASEEHAQSVKLGGRVPRELAKRFNTFIDQNDEYTPKRAMTEAVENFLKKQGIDIR